MAYVEVGENAIEVKGKVDYLGDCWVACGVSCLEPEIKNFTEGEEEFDPSNV